MHKTTGVGVERLGEKVESKRSILGRSIQQVHTFRPISMIAADPQTAFPEIGVSKRRSDAMRLGSVCRVLIRTCSRGDKEPHLPFVTAWMFVLKFSLDSLSGKQVCKKVASYMTALFVLEPSFPYSIIQGGR